MSIDMYVGSSQRQAASTQRMAQKQLEAYAQMERAIGQFVFNSQLLTGAAYDAAKSHYSSVLLPLLKGGKLYSEAVTRCVSKLPSDYQAQVDSGDLKESELEQKIKQLQASIDSKRAAQLRIAQMERDLPPDSRGNFSSSNRSLATSIETLERTKKKLQEKLQKLREFNISSMTIFSGLDGLERNIAAGNKLAVSSFNGKTFVKPSQSQLAWADEINNRWQKSEEEKFQKAKGSKTKQWISYLSRFMYVENPNHITPEELRFNEQYKERLFPKEEFEEDKDLTLIIAEAIRDGIDPFTGRELNWMTKASLALFAIALVAPSGKVSNSSFKGKMPSRVKLQNGKTVNSITGKVIKNNNKSTQGSRIKNNPNVLRDGSHLENGKLKSNVRYEAGEYNYSYKTDKLGRIDEFSTENLALTERSQRLEHNPNTPGKLKGDHAGHLAGDRFGGSPDLDNLVSQLENVNLSSYKKIENQWAKAISEGKMLK